MTYLLKYTTISQENSNPKNDTESPDFYGRYKYLRDTERGEAILYKYDRVKDSYVKVYSHHDLSLTLEDTVSHYHLSQ